MKNWGLLAILFVAIFSINAHADAGNCFDGGSQWDCDLLSTTLVPLMMTASTSGGLDADKQAYIAQVRDDAAEFVAADGAEAASAVLQEAIDQVRAQHPQARDLSDLEIARDLMK